ncbi:MAG: hypothetical protein ACPG8W_01810 [Candidatus Promineifilaceae bacterium]
MAGEQTLEQLLADPQAATAWQLRGDLLELGHAPDTSVLQILGDYHQFLLRLTQVTSAVEYTQLAYWLSAGAALVSFVSDSLEMFNPFAILSNLLPKGLDEGLDILAAGNYVNSAETAFPPITQQAAWKLYNHIWQLAQTTQPTLTLTERRQLLDQLFEPLHTETRPVARTIIIGRLFQYALLIALGRPT